METISFIIAARNVSGFVGAAVQSALSQAGCEPYVIVTDDGSTDGTAEVVRSFAARDPRVVLVEHREAAGPGGARNSALKLARGDWIAILDADDLIVPGRTRKLLDLASATSADIVADNLMRFWDGGLSPSKPMFPVGPVPYLFLIGIRDFILSNVMYSPGMGFGYLKPMIRTKFLRSHAITYDTSLRIGEDYEFALSCLLSEGRYVVTSEPLYHYRIRDGSVSHVLKNSDLQLMLSAHAKSERLIQARGGLDAAAASCEYAESLRRAMSFNTLVDYVKAKNMTSALAKASAEPALWPLIAKFGAEAALKRIRQHRR